MATKTPVVSLERYQELVELFATRAADPHAYLDLDCVGRRQSDLLNEAYAVNIRKKQVGHATLVLAELETGLLGAIPFALDPNFLKTDMTDEDFVYGFHRHVAREALASLDGIEHSHNIMFYLWQLSERQVFAGATHGRALFPEQIQATKRLAEQLPTVSFGVRRLDDDAYVKVDNGTVTFRGLGRGATWHELA